MVTGAAIAVVKYSASVFFGAILVRLLFYRRAKVRAAATRITVLFGVICVTAVYIWLELGPEVDAKLAAEDRLALPPPAHSYAI